MEYKKRVTILGSTGSIGTQALDIIKKNPDRYEVEALSCMDNIDIIAEQIRSFEPRYVSVGNRESAEKLSVSFPETRFFYGTEGLVELAVEAEDDILLNSVVGMAGLIPTYEALLAGKKIALANKETLVAGGDLIMKTAFEKGVEILPVDSEHSAIFQCLQGNDEKSVKRVILTASGGPFHGRNLKELEHVTIEDALSHPTWSMGRKITVDSATMMNKGFEVIEARWLFGIEAKDIDVVVHPESIIHSMVEYVDGTVIAQLGDTDMRLPIAYALDHPKREVSQRYSLDLTAIGTLTFKKPDKDTFICLKLAYDALEAGGASCTALNAANEICVSAFLEGKIKFLAIQDTLKYVAEKYAKIPAESLEDIMYVDREAREEAGRLLFS